MPITLMTATAAVCTVEMLTVHAQQSMRSVMPTTEKTDQIELLWPTPTSTAALTAGKVNIMNGRRSVGESVLKDIVVSLG